MTNNVGEIIRKRRETVRMTKSMLARKLGCSPQNIDSLERRKSIDFELAQRISVILEFDLFSYFRLQDPERDEVISDLQAKLSEIKDKYLVLMERHNNMLEKLNERSIIL